MRNTTSPGRTPGLGCHVCASMAQRHGILAQGKNPMRRFAVLLLALSCTITVHAAKPVARMRVAFDRDGVNALQAQGMADVAAGRTITVDDPVRIASISKLVTTIGVMRLVEQGKLNLDADVSKQLGWTLRNPSFPDRAITLRMLLSHTSSLTDGAGYWNVPLGSELRTLTNDPKAWDSAHAPGMYFRYTNLNFPLVAQLMERATGERFDLLMRRLVLEPLKLDACFNWSGCSDKAIQHAVVLYDDKGTPQKDDLHGVRPDCPVIVADHEACDLARSKPGSNGALFSPQGGLRISVRDLARIGRLLLNDGTLDGVRILKPSSVRILTTPVWTWNGSNGEIGEDDEPNRGGFFCSYGLAMQHLASGDGKHCRDDLFGDGRKRIGHSGNAYGLLSGLWVDRERGNGVAYFATGVANDSSGAHSAFSAIEEQAAAGW
ncbi:serine hydrolase domain-containing protein [Thermomonas sp.]|uniref:serine hydrolase domain-containing protein n=1 Tax=Thermomonas sp. TaxID=1971895 RepID=UPI00248912BD|nr:serine hydrolase domain-containing protein [Thermomonas sp.]MDI1252681.1 serine hydrolase [Thermomonas sp.]